MFGIGEGVANRIAMADSASACTLPALLNRAGAAKDPSSSHAGAGREAPARETGIQLPAWLLHPLWIAGCYAFALAMLSLPELRLVLADNDTHHGVAALLAVALAGVLLLGHRAQKSLVSAIRLKFQLLAERAERLHREKEEAEGANREKTRFLASASHDLRQPVHALTLFADALQSELVGHRAQSLLDNMGRSIEALNQLLGSLLDISKLDAHLVEANPVHFRLRTITDLLYAEYAPQARAKNLAFVVRVPDDVVIHSDRVLLETMLRNLVSNAIRYTHRGSIDIACVRVHDTLHIAVRDTGIGISPAHHREIFREFYQLGNPERDRLKGLGLGLAIVERLAALLDHRIAVESEEGKGSCFTIVAAAGNPAQVTAGESTVSCVDGSDLQNLRVLVIDDEIAVRKAMHAVLLRWNVEPILAGSEEEAIAKMAGGAPPEVIVADYRLREGKTGAQAIERIRREFGANIPAIIITGDTHPDRLREAQACGHTLMHKPVQPAKLLAYLRRVRRARITVQ